MLRFNSLTGKFIFIGAILLTFLIIYIYAGYRFTHYLGGEATRINRTGQ